MDEIGCHYGVVIRCRYSGEGSCRESLNPEADLQLLAAAREHPLQILVLKGLDNDDWNGGSAAGPPTGNMRPPDSAATAITVLLGLAEPGQL